MPGDHIAQRRLQCPGIQFPSSRTAAGLLYTAGGPSSWAMNHSRCWANDNGTRPRRSRGPSGSLAGPAWSSTRG